MAVAQQGSNVFAQGEGVPAGQPAVNVRDAPALYERQRLIEQQVPFLAPGARRLSLATRSEILNQQLGHHLFIDCLLRCAHRCRQSVVPKRFHRDALQQAAI